MGIKENFTCLKTYEQGDKVINIQKVEVNIDSLIKARINRFPHNFRDAAARYKAIVHVLEGRSDETLEDYNNVLCGEGSKLIINKEGLGELIDYENGSRFAVYYPYATGNVKHMDGLAHNRHWAGISPYELKKELYEAAGLVSPEPAKLQTSIVWKQRKS